MNNYAPVLVSKEGSDRTLDVYSRLLADRIVMLGTPVTDHAANSVIAQLLYLEAQSDSPISLYINSPGGSMYYGFAIYDTIQYIRADVSTISLGWAMSMAAVLLASGRAGRRFALANSRIMIHQGSAKFDGMPTDIEIHAKEILRMRSRAAEMIARHSGKSVATVMRDIERDYFMTAEDAREYGLIDEVITSRVHPALASIGALPH